jgi:hypothetical protein
VIFPNAFEQKQPLPREGADVYSNLDWMLIRVLTTQHKHENAVASCS